VPLSIVFEALQDINTLSTTAVQIPEPVTPIKINLIKINNFWFDIIAEKLAGGKKHFVDCVDRFCRCVDRLNRCEIRGDSIDLREITLSNPA
jgi:hypothetical protein